jgi:hypothetical protein
VLILLLSIFIFFTINYFDTKSNLQKYKIENHNLENSNRLLKYSLFQTIVFNQDTILKIVNINDSIVFLSQKIDKNTLVLRFSDNSCTPCLKRELNNISLLEKRGIPVLIISSYNNKREFKALLQEYDIKSDFLLLEQKQELFPFDKISSDLYVFLLTKDLEVKYLFFPVQTEDYLSVEYFNFIENLFNPA